MRLILLPSVLVFLIGCSTKSPVAGFAPEGNWEIVETKCEKNDYTDAGMELRKFYQKSTNTRQLKITDNKIFAKIIIKEDKKNKVKPCLIEISNDVVWSANEVSNLDSVVKKTSKLDKKCQGTKKVKINSKSQFALEGDLLRFSHKGPVVRIDPKRSPISCKNSPHMIVYKRM